jgi:hypothetical protein
MTETERRKLDALEAVLNGIPPYPKGTLVREMQDERNALRAKANKSNA